jgi:membrane protein YdbS with pleckstrin-like domain
MPGLTSPEEEVLFRSRPHWTAALPRQLWLVLPGGSAAITAAIGITRRDPGIIVLGCAVLTLFLVASLSPFMSWGLTSYVLTPRRISLRTGVVARRGVDISLDSIRTVEFDQSPLKRFLGCGDVLVTSAGSKGKIVFHLADPEGFQSRIHAARSRRSGQPGSTPMPTENGIARLQMLADLRERGLITQERFRTAKSVLL